MTTREEPRLLSGTSGLIAEVPRPDSVLLKQHLQMRPVHVAPPRELRHRTACFIKAALEKRSLGLIAGDSLRVAERARARFAGALACRTVLRGRSERNWPNIRRQMLHIRRVPGQT